MLVSCPDTAIYDYDKESKEWKADVTGPLFLIHRLDKPFFSLMVASVGSLDVRVVPLTGAVRMKLAFPFIYVYRPEGECFAVSRVSVSVVMALR